MSETDQRRLARFAATGPLPEKGPTLLEASAGTGKTYTITSLVLRLVAEQRLALPEILIVTFTRAATAELRERVRRRLTAALHAVERALAEDDWTPDPDDDAVIHYLVCSARDAGRDADPDTGSDELEARRAALSAAREDFDHATIATIHGFCHDTLHHSAFESNIDVGAELVDDLSELLEEITHDFLVRELRHSDLDWYRYLQQQGVDRRALLELGRRVEAEPHLRIIPEDPDGDPRQLWLDTLARFRRRWREASPALLDWLQATCEERGITRRYTPEKIAKRQAVLDAWCADDDPATDGLDEVCDAAAYFTRDAIASRLKGGRTVPADLELTDACARFLDLVGRPASVFKVRFAAYIRHELEARKRQRNILSFSDLLRRLADALEDPGTGSALRAAIRSRYRAALIDEFQDTDPVQWRIFEAAFDDAWLYLIGDPKQAIYAFRGADVYEYLDAARTVGRDRRYTLDVNWRSDQRFIDALNHLLDQDDLFGGLDIRYVEVEAAPTHKDDRLTVGGHPTAPLVLRYFGRELADADEGKPINKGWAKQALPQQVSAEIVAFLESGAKIQPDDRARPRPVEPRDVAVLVRTNARAERIQAALIEAGVQAVVGGGASVYATQEATVMQRLLDGLLRPHAEPAIKAAITTPLFGVTANELAAMETDERRWERWVEQLTAWSARWRRDGISEAVRIAFAEREVAARVLRLPRGERRMSNVLHLLELLHAAETEGRLGPTALAAWLRSQREDELRSDETELRLESDEAAVQVLTVHRSKGLEFPVVWCPDLWGSRLLSRSNPNLRFHRPPERELTLDVHVSEDRPPKAVHKRYAAREAWSEQLRLLYVALTRAKHRCVVYWGPFRDAGHSPLAHVLHGAAFTDGPDGPEAPQKQLTSSDETLLAELERLAETSGGRIAVERVRTVARAKRLRSQDGPGPEALRVRPYTRGRFDRSWRRTSFTALTRPLHEDEPEPGSPAAAGRDRDAGSADAGLAGSRAAGAGRGVGAGGGGRGATRDERTDPDALPTEALPNVPLADVPAGIQAGTFLHGVLEDIDFTQARTADHLERYVARRAERHRLTDIDQPPLLAGLRAALATPLGPLMDDGRLADIVADDRLDELEFDLSLAGGHRPVASGGRLDLTKLAAVLRAHGDASPAAGAYAAQLARWDVHRPTRGFLTGAIDLVARREVEGHPRFFVIDYKSNWLGERRPDGDRSTVAHYHPDALATQMVERHYVLQYHLYLVALHRFLRWRLGEAYDYDRHVGGALYLFLRGMVGPDVPRDDTGQPHGVFADRPPRALIDDLDALLHDPAGSANAPRA